MNYVSWRLRSIPSLVHSIKSPRRFLSILCQTVEDNTVYTDVIEVISFFFFFNHYYSRTPVTRTLRGNKKQFELAGISSYRGKFIETAQMFSGDLRADLISHVDVMIHKYIFFTLFAIFLEKKRNITNLFFFFVFLIRYSANTVRSFWGCPR